MNMLMMKDDLVLSLLLPAVYEGFCLWYMIITIGKLLKLRRATAH